jgi:Sec7-like guanine-nucleotide exchange factor
VVALETCQGAQETLLGTKANCNICLRHHLYYASKDVRNEHQQSLVSAVVSVENDIDTALTLVMFARLRVLHLHH